MKRCGCCGRKSPSLKRALVFAPEVPPEIKLACRRCRLRAMPVVTPPPIQVAPLCSSCGKERANIGAECVARLGDQITELTRANVRLQQALADHGRKAKEE
jgi:hypothetical protein